MFLQTSLTRSGQSRTALDLTAQPNLFATNCLRFDAEDNFAVGTRCAYVAYRVIPTFSCIFTMAMQHNRVSGRRWVRRLDYWRRLDRPSGRRLLMHLSYTFPNPLARLTGLLDVLERSRAAGAPVDADPNKAVKGGSDPGSGPRADHHDDLESMSLSREGATLEPHTHDLDALSLCRIEAHRTGAGDDLDDASLSRTPQRPLL
jgi:hypothetical protein